MNLRQTCLRQGVASEFRTAFLMIGLSMAVPVVGLAESASPLSNVAAVGSQLRIAQPIHDTGLFQQVNQAFNLNDATLITLDLPASVNEGVEALVPIDGESVTVFMTRHSIRSKNFKLLVQIDDGSFVEETPAEELTMRGEVLEYPGSAAAGSLLPEGLACTFRLPDGRRYWIEPVAPKLPFVDQRLHVLYRGEDVIPSGGTCANDAHSETSHGDGEGSPRGAACGTGLCFAELAIDADFDYFADWGSTTAVQNRVNLVVNTFNIQYENDVDITHVISAFVIRTSDPADPYTSTNSNTLVGQLRNEWLNNLNHLPRDITHLFTGKEIDGSVIGQAFNIGIVCSNQAYSYAQSDCCGSLSCSADLSAHENGHVWGGFHCDPCGGTTMQSSLQCANNFAQVNINQITAHRDSRSCLGNAAAFVPPFFDDFPTTTIDGSKWSIVTGPVINSLGVNEPSAPNSLNIDGNDSITSWPMDMSVTNNPVISYWWQRTGGGDSPEDSDNLNVEYLNAQNQWVVLVSHPGAGPDNDPYHFESFTVPEDGKHGFFRLRFRGTSPATNGTDDYFIDDVFVDTGDITPPEPNPMSFSSNPIALTSTTMTMEATLATDPAGPVEYFFERMNGDPAGATSGWQTSRTWVATLTVHNSPFNFRVRARDGAPYFNPTLYSASVLGYSGIETPVGITSTPLDGTSIQLTAQGTFTALNFAQSGLFFELTDEMGQPAGTGANVWTQVTTNTSVVVTGLTPGVQYTARVKARNRVAVETPFTSSITAVTLDVIEPLAPVLSNATATTLDLAIATNGNPAGTKYAIQCVNATPADPTWIGQYIVHATGLPAGSEDWQTAGAAIVVSALQPNTQYTFAVKAQNASATATTGFGPNGAGVTLALVPGAAVIGPDPLSTATIDITPDNDPSLSNPADTTYAIHCQSSSPLDPAWDGKFVDASGNPGDVEAWRTDAEWGVATIFNLKPNTEYAFEVKARNRAGAETPYGPSAAFTTGEDCNLNGIADATDIANCAGDPACDDCNSNGVPDVCDLGFEISQWAGSVIDFSSQYDEALPGYGAVQTLGAPNVAAYGDSPLAWTPLDADSGLEHVTVGFAVPVFAEGAVIRENLNNGFVVRIDAVKLDDTLEEVWPLATGETDTSTDGVLADFSPTWAPTAFLVKGLKVTIDTDATPGDYEEIDAIQLIGRTAGTEVDANENGIPDSCEVVNTGACCIGDGSCVVQSEAACTTGGGSYQGNDTTCEPNPCIQPCALLGDINGDEAIDALDIDGYLRAKLGLPALPGENQSCADFGNGNLNDDTADFVDALIGG